MRQPYILVGFDGFVDEILEAIDTRYSQDRFTSIKSISEFAERIAKASGKSCNIEWISHSIQLGGNAPLLARALLAQDARVAFIGACGTNSVFAELQKSCNPFYSLCEPGYTNAIEFQDGKIFLGKTTSLQNITPEIIEKKIGTEQFFSLFSQIDAFACVNWTMIPNMSHVWKWMCQNMPPLPKKPVCLIDLADPKKRTPEDIQEALAQIQQLQQIFDVILSFNQAEGEQIATQLEIEHPATSSSIQRALKISHTLLHTKTICTVSSEKHTWEEPVSLITHPKRLTGAGDNFNAGFLIEFLRTHDPKKSLQHAIKTAQFLIQNGQSYKNHSH